MEHIQRIVDSDVVSGKMDTLKRKYQHLESKREDTEQELRHETESSTRKRPRNEVQNWIANVRGTKIKVDDLEREVSRSGFVRRLLVEGKVDSLTKEVTELIEQGRFASGLTLETYDSEKVELLTKRLIGTKFKENKKKILDCLLGGEDSVVGVWGMGGVGKTTLISHIHNKLLHDPNVHVCWVTVSQNFSIQKLQYDIAKKINFDLSGEDDERIRAAELAKALAERKNLILILDDVWEHIALEDVGIRVGENVWKLVLTTRSLTVCRMLHCESPIKVEPLSEVEAWMLFTETLGNEALLSEHHQIKGIAKSLVSECDGLPLGIVVMAGSMRCVDDIHEWRNALEEIKDAKYRSNDMEFYDRVFLVLRYSHDRLKDPKVKECLLYCSLFPEDALIERDELIDYFIDENLTEGRNSRRSAFDRGHTILNKLVNVCLLEARTNMKGKMCVKMHDLVRDMAIKIASKSPHRYLVQAGMRLNYGPNEEQWSEDLLRVSLMRNQIANIPSNSSPKCPILLTLLLSNNNLRVIRDDFFMHMKLLTVLDLSHNPIKILPTSIANLESLNSLRLGGCSKLRYVPSLENLKALRRLDLSQTDIEEVPKGMEKLINLRYLNLGGCQNLKMIPNGFLLQLPQMECFKSNYTIGLRGAEIGSWRMLETLNGNFYDIDNLNTCGRLWGEREPKEYTISVGFNEWINESKYVLERNVCVFKVEDMEETFALPSNPQLIELKRCDGIRSLSHITTLRKATDLRCCEIDACKNIRHVICSCCCNVLFSQTLETLHLGYLPMLTDLVERERSQSPPSSSTTPVPLINTFSSLKELEISGCHQLKNLFTPALFSALQSLEKLDVSCCAELVEIVGEGISDDEDEDENEEATTTTLFTLPNLKDLTLSRLPKFKRICNSSLQLSDNLQRIRIGDCPEMKKITLLWEDPNRHTSLQEIKVDEEWWQSVKWKHPQTKAVLQPFVKFFYRAPLWYTRIASKNGS